ncbi:hypothetical protein [Serratia rhizosphaerae]
MAKNIMAIVLAIAAAFVAGWKVANWQRDSNDLLIERAASAAGAEARKESQAIASQSGRELENKLEELKGAIPASVRTEVVKPVFTHVCVSDDFVRMYNDAAENAERVISGKSKNKVPN